MDTELKLLFLEDNPADERGLFCKGLRVGFYKAGIESNVKGPMAVLTDIMIKVAIGTFEWASIKMTGKMPRHDIFVGMLVAAITVLFHNLALAVLIGVVISALVFAWESARRIRAKKYVDEKRTYHYEIFGP